MEPASPFEIATFEPGHQDAARSLAAEILCEEYGVQSDLSQEHDLTDIAAAYAAPESRFLVGMVHGQLVATGAIRRISAEDCELGRLYVQADYRRQGIASAIVSKLVRFVRGREYRRILLEVRPEMKEDRKVYRRYGFADVEASAGTPRDGSFMAILL